MRFHTFIFVALCVLLLGAGAGLAGFLVSASGVIPIEASAGHWAITEWILIFSKERSVATHTLGLVLPPLDDPALVLRGAGHYEGACAPCHGSPALPRMPRVPQAMLPPPPNMAEVVPKYQPKGLFYIVKHGIKFTGMPAWPTQKRDDEVHAVVAFLLRYPTLDAEGYRRLVHGDAATSKMPELSQRSPSPVASCTRCHGDAGRGRENSAFPRLAGQRAEYMTLALEAYAADHRYSGIMQPVAAAMSADEMRESAQYFAKQEGWREPAAHGGDAAQLARGREIATRGIAAQKVPACAGCHGPNPERNNPAYPLLAGQYAEYIVQQLELFQGAQRGGTHYRHLMYKVIPQLRADQMRDVAAYYASLPAMDAGSLSAR